VLLIHRLFGSIRFVATAAALFLPSKQQMTLSLFRRPTRDEIFLLLYESSITCGTSC
jgi:hypothetical protein